MGATTVSSSKQQLWMQCTHTLHAGRTSNTIPEEYGSLFASIDQAFNRKTKRNGVGYTTDLMPTLSRAYMCQELNKLVCNMLIRSALWNFSVWLLN